MAERENCRRLETAAEVDDFSEDSGGVSFGLHQALWAELPTLRATTNPAPQAVLSGQLLDTSSGAKFSKSGKAAAARAQVRWCSRQARFGAGAARSDGHRLKSRGGSQRQAELRRRGNQAVRLSNSEKLQEERRGVETGVRVRAAAEARGDPKNRQAERDAELAKEGAERKGARKAARAKTRIRTRNCGRGAKARRVG